MRRKKINFKGICIATFVVALVCTILANIMIPKNDIASRFKFPLLIVSVVLLVILLVLSIKKAGATTAFFNALLSVVMIFGCIAVPKLEEKDKNVFQEPAKKSQVTINFYALTSEYKSNHSSLFSDTAASDNILDYANKTFLTQTQFDSTNTENALSQIETVLETKPNVISKDTVYDAIKAFYNGEADVLVLNDAFVSALKTIKAFKNFEKDTIVLSSLKFGEEEVQETAAPVNQQNPFVVYVAGNDTRANGLTTVGRTDVNMIMAVNPASRQILLVSIPRDYYIENPGLENGIDKLTHLGNQGIRNTLDGINQKFGLNITDYLTTNFTHFEALVDALGGVTIDNPYAFDGDNSGDYHFDAGMITLNGEQALAWAYLADTHNTNNSCAYLFWTSVDTNSVGEGVTIPVIVSKDGGGFYVSDSITATRINKKDESYIAISDHILNYSGFKQFTNGVNYGSLEQANTAYSKYVHSNYPEFISTLPK